MIAFDRFELENGLKVLVHEDDSTPMAVVNILYHVGSRNEEETKTGFAHLFEHLMFGGSENIKDFDGPIQMAGGENNAFTNADITNFYTILPAQNIETAFWLESDRMNQLAFSQKNLNKEKLVVIEEFKETCLNLPYGEVWHHLSSMAYKKHPYRWPTIGLVPEHIENAQLEDVKDFFYRYYRPNNAILVVSGNVKLEQIKELSNRWFGSIPKGDFDKNPLPVEDKKSQDERKVIEKVLPSNAIYLAWAMPGRLDPDYYICDIISDALANGRSSRLFRKLKKEKALFTSIDAYVSGTMDPGLFIIEGKPMPDVSVDDAIQAIQNELDDICNNGLSEEELVKLKNKIESSLVFSEVSILNKAMNLAIYECLGDVNLINNQSKIYEQIKIEDVKRVANQIFKQPKNELIYKSTVSV